MKFDLLLKECVFKASRSSGKGGQHINKVSTKMELFFDIENSSGLTEEEKTLLKERLSSKLTKENVLHLYEFGTRSQIRNKINLIEKFEAIISKSLFTQKKRKPTKIPKRINEKRLKAKKMLSGKKDLRKKDF